jgi:parallel beta-helix repeat protein
MRLTTKHVTAGLALALAFAALPAVAAEGRIPIWQPVTIGPGMEGKYIVTRDVSAQPGIPAIDILPGTVTVDIDLNGFTLYGLDTDVIRAVEVDSLTVRNGTIMFGTRNGILASGCRKAIIEDVKIQFVDLFGINLINVANFAIRRNILVDEPEGRMYGILVDGIGAPDPLEGIIQGNQIEKTQGGIDLRIGSSVAIKDNRIEEIANGDGILVFVCDGCMIAENTIQLTGGSGIVLRDVNVCKVHNNVVFGAGADGIALLNNTSDCFVFDNNSSQNNGNGLAVDGQRNFIDHNVFNMNGLAGIWFMQSAGFNTFGRNTARGNSGFPGPCTTTPPPCAPPDICDDFPVFNNNTSFNDNMGPGPGC